MAAVDWALAQFEARHAGAAAPDIVPLIETARGMLALAGVR